MPLDFEVVLDRASDADFWVNPDNSFWRTPADVLASDERYGEFAPFQTGSLFNNNRIANENGGLGIFESGAANPHLILMDLVHIFHPELLPDHELVYYQVVE
jgi:iron complex transport system substrate-binding protein